MFTKALGEARWIFAILIAGWLIAIPFLPELGFLFAGLILFTFYFFRDPERVPPEGENDR